MSEQHPAIKAYNNVIEYMSTDMQYSALIGLAWNAKINVVPPVRRQPVGKNRFAYMTSIAAITRYPEGTQPIMLQLSTIFAELPLQVRVFIIAHELMHIYMGHHKLELLHYKYGPMVLAAAVDVAVNQELDDTLLDADPAFKKDTINTKYFGVPEGLTVEDYCKLLQKNRKFKKFAKALEGDEHGPDKCKEEKCGKSCTEKKAAKGTKAKVKKPKK